jgi:uncharacterized glyoxalase superfamily protein PhnB
MWDAYIRMDSVHDFYEEVRAQPFIQMALKKQPYGDWEFEVRDLNGYVLVFGGDAHVGEGGTRGSSVRSSISR